MDKWHEWLDAAAGGIEDATLIILCVGLIMLVW